MVQAFNTSGPVIIHRPRKGRGTEETSAQALSSLNIEDSRLMPSSYSWLRNSRIREIRKDATIQLARMAVLAPIIHTPWRYETKKDVPEDAVQFLRDNLETKREWFLQNAIYSALDYGWAPFEVVYKYEEDRVKIQNLKSLLVDYTTILVYLENGGFAGFVNEPHFTAYYPADVIMLKPYAMNINLVVEGTDWYGESVSWVLDPIVSSWNDVDTVANRFDRKVAGSTWVVYYPVGTTPLLGVDTDNSTIADNILKALEASGAVAIPDEIQEWLDDSVDRELKGKWRVELITSTNSAQASFIDRLRYLDTLKIRAFGIPERSILEGRFGTKAEAEAHADIALGTVDTKHCLVCDQINQYVVQPLLKFNYGDKYKESVWIQPAPIVDAQFQTIKEIYRLLVQSPEVIAHEIQNISVETLRDQLGIPSNPDAPNDYGKILEDKERGFEMAEKAAEQKNQQREAEGDANKDKSKDNSEK